MRILFFLIFLIVPVNSYAHDHFVNCDNESLPYSDRDIMLEIFQVENRNQTEGISFIPEYIMIANGSPISMMFDVDDSSREKHVKAVRSLPRSECRTISNLFFGYAANNGMSGSEPHTQQYLCRVRFWNEIILPYRSCGKNER